MHDTSFQDYHGEKRYIAAQGIIQFAFIYKQSYIIHTACK